MKNRHAKQNRKYRGYGMRPAVCAPRMHTGGSALIALIAALLIGSVLATAIIPLVSSSGRQTIVSNLADQALKLAESGLRHAQGQYRRSGPAQTDRHDTLDDLGGNYTLEDDAGRFTLEIDSYFYEINQAVANSATFDTRAPGSFPSGNLFISGGSGLKVLIGNTIGTGHIRTLTDATLPATEDDNTVTFTLNQPLVNVPAGTIVYPLVEADSAQSLSNGDTLSYKANTGGMFPLQNGVIRVNGTTLTYRYNDRANHCFRHVSDPDNNLMTGLAVPADTPIILNRYAEVNATGIAGGSGLETRRSVRLFNALSALESDSYWVERKIGLADMDVLSGSAELQQIGQAGDSTYKQQVIKITGVDADTRSVLALKAETLERAFTDARRTTGGYLSYDAQTKVGFDPAEPDNFAAGLSFRLDAVDGNYTGYGLSFLKVDNTALLPENMAPLGTGKNMIVLWQRTNAGSDYQWLAYKTMEDALYDEDFETDDGNWTASNEMWSYSAAGGHWYCDRNTTSADFGSLTSPEISLEGQFPQIYLQFDHIPNTSADDIKYIYIIRQSGVIIYTVSGSQSVESRTQTISLTALAGELIQVRFFFHKGISDHTSSLPPGWYIQNVRIVAEWPRQDATVCVRLKEAALLGFDSGGTYEIQSGDRVYGSSSGTRGTVVSPPVLTSSDWAGGTASGVLLLNNLSAGSFTVGEPIVVFGRGQAATVTTFTNATDRKANVIKAYYASSEGYLDGDDDPLNRVTKAYPRLDSETDPLRWPVEDGGNWTADQDYFRLIQWEAVNDAAVSDLSLMTSLQEPDAVLRHTHAELQSPSGTSFTRSELGLHAYGPGATSVYFDDLGVRVYLRSFQIPAVQQ